VPRSLFKGLRSLLLPVLERCFITLSNLLRSILFKFRNQFLLSTSNLSKIWVIFYPFEICVFVLQSVPVYHAVLVMYFISAADILVASLALTVLVSMQYNNIGMVSVLHNFVLVFWTVFVLNTLYIILVNSKRCLSCYHCPVPFHNIFPNYLNNFNCWKILFYVTILVPTGSRYLYAVEFVFCTNILF
jgi:hypothetical protein